MAGTKTKTYNSASTHERLSELGGKAAKTAATEVRKAVLNETSNVVKGINNEFWAQILGIDTHKKEAKKADAAPNHEQKPQPGVTVDLVNFLTGGGVSAEKHEKKDKPRIEAAMNYSRDIMQNSERASRHEMTELTQNIREIQQELKKLLSSSKVLQMEFNEVAVEQAPTEVGKYHMNFFEWMLLVIKQAREKVEDSGAWLNTVKGKNAKKGYWGMFKKHGTSFGLSNERSVSTQTG